MKCKIVQRNSVDLLLNLIKIEHRTWGYYNLFVDHFADRNRSLQRAAAPSTTSTHQIIFQAHVPLFFENLQHQEFA